MTLSEYLAGLLEFYDKSQKRDKLGRFTTGGSGSALPNGADPDVRYQQILKGEGKPRPDFDKSNTPAGPAVAKFREFMASDPPISIRVPSSLLGKVARAGRFKSQQETGDSMGSFAPDLRDEHEANMFGAPMTRPIYGYVQDNTNLTSHGQVYYGDVVAVLKEDVKDRTTLTWGDSLNTPEPPAPIPYRDVSDRAHDDRIKAAISSKWEANEPSYIEAQFHGPVRVRDIDHFEVHIGNADRRRRGDRSVEEDVARAFPDIELRIIGEYGDPEKFSTEPETLNLELHMTLSTGIDYSDPEPFR